jgi:hypothetical protein
MKQLKKILRLCALILFMAFAAAGIGILGVAPTSTKDNKLFPDIEAVFETTDNAGEEDIKSEKYQ